MSNILIYIFRRDLRIIDNLGWIQALNNEDYIDKILPIFIFTPEQININKNNFFSHNSVQFMCESLNSLNNDIKKLTNNLSHLHFFKGSNISVLKTLKSYFENNGDKIKYICFNQDYTPYAKSRDKEIYDFCYKNNINCNITEDYLLSPIGTFLLNNDNAYKVYTPFKNKVYKELNNILKPDLKHIKDNNKLFKINKNIGNQIENISIFYEKNDNINIKGGRLNGLKLLNKINLSQINEYENKRNDLSYETTKLSAYIKYGNLSIREIFWKCYNLKKQNTICDQLIWREFYFYIVYYYPKVLSKRRENFQEKYNKIKWNKNINLFNKWKNAQTGYPIVDACMTELNTIGYMHNRGRLISSNFLNRMYGMDWRQGEEYFANKLIDYDPSVNNGNWQWIASTGVDPKPYFQRLFNPWLQSEKYDSQCKYIKKWLPNLKNIPNQHLHKWDQYYQQYDLKEIKYYKPSIDYSDARQKSILQYKLN